MLYPLKIIGVMPAHFQYTQALSFPLNRAEQMFARSIHPFLKSRNGQQFAGLIIMFYLAENPWVANARPANHDSIHSVAVFVLHRFLGSVDIAIAKHRNLHAWVVAYFGDQAPVGLAFVHLGAR